MSFQANYLSIKPIFDLALFGVEDAEKTFSTNETLVFSKEFSSYQLGFLTDSNSEGNKVLLKTCTNYLSNLEKPNRQDIVNVILENSPLAEALIMLSMMNDGVIDPEKASMKFLFGLRAFIEQNKISESIILFFQQHFLNFERIQPSSYQNFKLTRSEYFHLISDYLKVQSNIF